MTKAVKPEIAPQFAVPLDRAARRISSTRPRLRPEGSVMTPTKPAQPTALEEMRDELRAMRELLEQFVDSVPRDSKTRPLREDEIEVGAQVLTRVTHQVVLVEVVEMVPLASGTVYKLRRTDNGRMLGSLRAAGMLFPPDTDAADIPKK